MLCKKKQVGGRRWNVSKYWGPAPWFLSDFSSFLSLRWTVQQLHEVGAETPHILVLGLGGSHWITAWPKAKATSLNCSKLCEGQLSFRASQPKLRVSPSTLCLLTSHKYFSTTLTSLLNAVRHKEERGSFAAFGCPFTPRDVYRPPLRHWTLVLVWDGFNLWDSLYLGPWFFFFFPFLVFPISPSSYRGRNQVSCSVGAQLLAEVNPQQS